jgi:hypothetical protein
MSSITVQQELNACDADIGASPPISMRNSYCSCIYFSLGLPVLILSIEWWLFCVLHVAYRPYEAAALSFEWETPLFLAAHMWKTNSLQIT